MSAAANKLKTDSEMAIEFIQAEFTRKTNEPMAILERMAGGEQRKK